MRDLEEEQQNESSGRKSISAAKGAEGGSEADILAILLRLHSIFQGQKWQRERRRERPKKNIIEKSSVGEFGVCLSVGGIRVICIEEKVEAVEDGDSNTILCGWLAV